MGFNSVFKGLKGLERDSGHPFAKFVMVRAVPPLSTKYSWCGTNET